MKQLHVCYHILETTEHEHTAKGPRTLQKFFQKNRCENRCPYIKLLKKSLQL